MMVKGSLKKTTRNTVPDDVKEKRTKVHAQRKFAQGSPSWTPVKDRDREREKASGSASVPNGTDTAVKDLIPDQCPKTEDFLTFLCLRGSDLLPPHLDFLSPSSSEKQPVSVENPSQSDTTNKPSNTFKEAPEKKLIKQDKSLPSKSVPVAHKYPALHSSFRKKTAIASLTSRSANLPLKGPKTRLQAREPLKTTAKKDKLTTDSGGVATRSRKLKESSKASGPNKETHAKQNRKARDKATVKSSTPAPAKKVTSPNKTPTATPNRKTSKVDKNKIQKTSTPASQVKRENKLKIPGVKRVRSSTIGSKNDKVLLESRTRSGRSVTSRPSEAAPSHKQSSRPQRRTKEAAALYLTLIGEDEKDSTESESEEDSEKYENKKVSTPIRERKLVATPKSAPPAVGTRSSATKRRAILREAARRFTSVVDSSRSSESNSSDSDESSDDSVGSEKMNLRSSASKKPTASMTNRISLRPRSLRKSTEPEIKKTIVESSSDEEVAKPSKKKRQEKAASPGPETSAYHSQPIPEAPVFYPTEKEFSDPIEYLQKIRPLCENSGICKIVPPPSFKPECEISDSMRFTAYNQYVHRMFRRSGPNVQQLATIRKHLESLNIDCDTLPCIGGIEVDLAGLYQAVEGVGGLKKVLEKNLWPKVADLLKIPRTAQDRFSKLDTIYCKYLVSYATLSTDERKKLQQKVRLDDDSESVVKGNNIPLSTFYRIARNTQAVWFPNTNSNTEASASLDPAQVENLYWKLATERTCHVCVLAASVDSGEAGYGFPCNKTSRHPWNLKVLTNNADSVLKSLGPVVGATVPTIHLGMLFTTCCWYRDPHGLPWIEYLHTGADKIWYAAAANQEAPLRKAMSRTVPDLIQDGNSLWLTSDTVMIPPGILLEEGVALKRTVQEAGQFIVVWPRSFTASICTGYTVSESVYFAPQDWLSIAETCFNETRESSEPTVFSLHHLLWSIATDSRASLSTSHKIVPLFERAINEEIRLRDQLRNGKTRVKESLVEIKKSDGKKKRRSNTATCSDETESECDICRMNLFFSRVVYDKPSGAIAWCLQHAVLKVKERPRCAANCKLLIAVDDEQLRDTLHQMKEMIRSKSQRRHTRT